MSVQNYVREMYNEVDKVGLFQPRLEVQNLDFVCVSVSVICICHRSGGYLKNAI